MGQRKTTPAHREKILDTASRLVRERGVATTTLADIATAAEISKGTLYYYYPTKGDLVFDIADRHMRKMTERIFNWIESSEGARNPRRVFRMVLDTVMHSRSRGQMHVYLLQEALTEQPGLRKRFVEEYQGWRTMIREGLDRVLEGDDDRDALAQVLLATIDGLVLQRLVGSDAVPVDSIARFFADSVEKR